MIPQDDMRVRQKDYAIFLPALSSFYTFQLGQPSKKFNPARMPSIMHLGVTGLDFLKSKDSYFYYPWCLYSAGHALLNIGPEPKETMVRSREPGSFILGDSGGFQIGKGKWPGDWANPNCPKAQSKRDGVLKWMDAYMDYGMSLDVPAWLSRSPEGIAATGIDSYQKAVDATKINNEYWIKNRTGKCKILNVLQGENHTQADDWYAHMKGYCDPKQYPDNHFNGWSMGGQNVSDVHLILRRMVQLLRDDLLQEGLHDWMHFLGLSKLAWSVMFTDIQRAVRKYHNKNFTVSYDCASPFLANAKGQVYTNTTFVPNGNWNYFMEFGIDDKKYATDNRLYSDVAVSDGILPDFTDSHISQYLKVSDICYYKPGDLNFIGKNPSTSWDTFSYVLQMAHNTWMHIDATQKANVMYDQGMKPSMMITHQGMDTKYFTDIVDEIFANADNSKADDLIEHYNRYWMNIRGQRGYVGKKAVNARSYYYQNFDEEVSLSIPEEPEAKVKPSSELQFNTMFQED